MTCDHDGKLIRFDLNGKRVSGTVVETHDRRHVTVRGRSGKTVKVDMLDQHGVVALPSGLEVTTIWRDQIPPVHVCDSDGAASSPDRSADLRGHAAAPETLKPKPKAKAQPTKTTEQMELL